jgi:hypothetical protein
MLALKAGGGTVMTADVWSWLSSAHQSLAALPKFVDDHNGALIAAATIVIAWFTFTLKRSSVKMWRVTTDAIILLERPQIGAYNNIQKYIRGRIVSKRLRHQLRIKFFDTEILPARMTAGATISTINIPVSSLGITGKTEEVAADVDTFEFDASKKAVCIWIRYEWSLGAYENSFACEVAYGRRPKIIGGKEYNYHVRCQD